MFENLKETINLLVDKEIEKKKEQVINDYSFNKGRLKAGLKLLDSNEIKKYYDSVSIETAELLFKDPHFEYSVNIYWNDYDDDDDDDWKGPDEIITVKAWLSDNLNEGVLTCIDRDNDVADVSHFKVHKRGKNGRGVSAAALHDKEKNFLEHYDNFVAELVLLGLDETSTESKG